MHIIERGGPMGPSLRRDLRFLYCGDAQCDGDGGYLECLRDHHRIYVMRKGRGQLVTRAGAHEVPQGSAFLVRPHQVSTLRPVKGRPWSYFWVAFTGEGAEAQASRTVFSGSTAPLPGMPVETLHRHYLELVEGCADPDAGDLRVCGVLHLFLAALVRSRPRKERAHAQAEGIARDAAAWIDANLSRRVTVAELTDLTPFDPKYFSRLFRRVNGCSPKHYLVRARMDRAEALLKTGSLPVASVARSVGYEDPLLFSKVFRKYRGRSPIEAKGPRP